MSKSVRRVEEAAAAADLNITVRRMPEGTRTAADAAIACGCDVARIVKSLIFESSESGELRLLLVSGRHMLDMESVSQQLGEKLRRANPRTVRDRTGFAIGGVAPIGHLAPVPVWMDDHLTDHETVWAAAGAPDAVFEITPADLLRVTSARPLKV